MPKRRSVLLNRKAQQPAIYVIQRRFLKKCIKRTPAPLNSLTNDFHCSPPVLKYAYVSLLLILSRRLFCTSQTLLFTMTKNCSRSCRMTIKHPDRSGWPTIIALYDCDPRRAIQSELYMGIHSKCNGNTCSHSRREISAMVCGLCKSWRAILASRMEDLRSRK